MPEKPIIPTTPSTAETDRKQDERATGGGASRVKALEGSTSIDDKVFLECEILAHAAIARIADEVAEEVMEAVKKNPSQPGAHPTLFFLDDSLAPSLHLFSSLQLQLALIEKSFHAVAPGVCEGVRKAAALSMRASTAPVLSTVTGVMEGAFDLLGLFRQDTQLTGRTVTIQETALLLGLARALRAKDCEVIYPKLLTFQADRDIQMSQDQLSKLFDAVFRARQEAADRLRPALQKLADLERAILGGEREHAEATIERQKDLEASSQDLKVQMVATKKDIDPDLVLFENTDSRWHELQKAMATADEKSGLVPLQMLSRAGEVIERFQSAESAYLLFASGVVAGGTMRIKKSLWSTLFTGDGLEFSGGAVVTYALLDGAARICASGTHRFMTPFGRFPDASKPLEGFTSLSRGA